MVFLGDWSAKGTRTTSHLMSLKLISKDGKKKVASSFVFHFCSEAKLLTRFVVTCRFIIIVNQNLCTMKTLIMNGCAGDKIEDIKTLSMPQKSEKNAHVLIISKSFRYCSPNCWWQVSNSQNYFSDPTTDLPFSPQTVCIRANK